MKNLDKGLGIWQIMNSNLVTDIISKAGFDFTILDLEHGLHTPETVQNCIYTAKSNYISTVLRLPNDNYPHLVQVIDSGIESVIFPHVETTKQLENIINQTFQYPRGNKSFSPFVPRFNYGNDYKIEEINPSLGILIESNLGIKNASSLLANPRVDYVYFGAYDLSVELGKPGKIFDKELLEILKELVLVTKSNNKKIMAIYRNSAELETLIELGIHFPVASVDTSQLIKNLNNEFKLYKKLSS